MLTPFILRFAETPKDEFPCSPSGGISARTRDGILAGTQTITEQREQADVDPKSRRSAIIPRNMASSPILCDAERTPRAEPPVKVRQAGTLTKTGGSEGKDSDVATRSYRAIPIDLGDRLSHSTS